MTELHDLLDAYAGESGAVKPDDGIMREQCARRAFTALRHVLDAMDLVTELMPKGTPAVPVSVLRGMITRALTDDSVVTIDPALPHTAVDCPGRIDVTTASDETAQFVHGRCPWLDRQGAVSVEGVLDSDGPIPPAGVDQPLGAADCPCLTWTVADMRQSHYGTEHHLRCDGTGQLLDKPREVDVDEDGWCRCERHQQWKREMQQ